MIRVLTSSSLSQHSTNLQVLQVTSLTCKYHVDKANKPSHVDYRFGQCFTAESLATQQTVDSESFRV